MAAPQYRPGKYLLLLLLLIVGLTAWAFAPIDGYSRTPRLGLDLRGQLNRSLGSAHRQRTACIFMAFPVRNER